VSGDSEFGVGEECPTPIDYETGICAVKARPGISKVEQKHCAVYGGEGEPWKPIGICIAGHKAIVYSCIDNYDGNKPHAYPLPDGQANGIPPPR